MVTESDIRLAEKELANQFISNVKKEFPYLNLSSSRNAEVYLSFFDKQPHFTFYVNCLGRDFDIRLDCPTEEQLQVGFSCRCLLTTNYSVNDTSAIENLQVVANIFADEEQWRKLICGLDYSNLKELMDRKSAEDKARAEAKVKSDLEAFEKAGIEVGTVILIGNGIEESVTRMSRTRVQVGRVVYSKQDVGARLLEGLWQVRK